MLCMIKAKTARLESVEKRSDVGPCKDFQRLHNQLPWQK